MTIEERLENMERELGRQKRRNRWLLGAILVLLGGLVAAGVFKTTRAQGTGTANVIRARNIIVEDKFGKVRGWLGVLENGPSLMLYDRNEKVCVGLIASEEHGPFLALFDENGEQRVGLGVHKDGPGLELSDENGHLRAELHVNKDAPSLSIRDENGKPRAMSDDVIKNLLLWNIMDYVRARASVLKDGPGMCLFGPDGKVIWSAIK